MLRIGTGGSSGELLTLGDDDEECAVVTSPAAVLIGRLLHWQVLILQTGCEVESSRFSYEYERAMLATCVRTGVPSPDSQSYQGGLARRMHMFCGLFPALVPTESRRFKRETEPELQMGRMDKQTAEAYMRKMDAIAHASW